MYYELLQISTASRLRLLPSSSLTYCDTEWLRQGMDMQFFDEQDGIYFIHDNVPVSTAEALNVPTLMSRMLHAEELEITGFGQTQPLTDRYLFYFTKCFAKYIASLGCLSVYVCLYVATLFHSITAKSCMWIFTKFATKLP